MFSLTTIYQILLWNVLPACSERIPFFCFFFFSYKYEQLYLSFTTVQRQICHNWHGQYRYIMGVFFFVLFVCFSILITTHGLGECRVFVSNYSYSCQHAQMCDVIFFSVCVKRTFIYNIFILLVMFTVVYCSIISKYDL